MPVWRDLNEPLTLPAGSHCSADNASIVVDPGAGTVQVQIQNSGDEWFTPDDTSYTLDAADVYGIPRRNGPEVRIIATDDAKFYVIGA